MPGKMGGCEGTLWNPELYIYICSIESEAGCPELYIMKRTQEGHSRSTKNEVKAMRSMSKL
jgi:hypothetical protein